TITAAGKGKSAYGSEYERHTKSETVFTKFQFASTAFTVTLNAAPAVCAVGVPALPVAVPGAAVSPGASASNLANAPAFTVTVELPGTLFVVTSEAVTVTLPAVLFVMLKLFVPSTSAA